MIHDMTIFGIHIFQTIIFGLNFFEIVGIITTGFFALMLVLVILNS